MFVGSFVGEPDLLASFRRGCRWRFVGDSVGISEGDEVVGILVVGALVVANASAMLFL